MDKLARRRGSGMTSQRARDRLITRLREQGIDDDVVLELMSAIPRHLFIDEALASRAYDDTALPIGFGQTISQPFVVALMTATLNRGPMASVLEVGTGCGYQTAVLAGVAKRLYSIERIGALLDSARTRVRSLGCSNVVFRQGDGYEGWQDAAPFDAILVAAAPEQVPLQLVAQLADGGRMVLPVGPEGRQQLRLITRRGNNVSEETLAPVSFVPLV